MNLERAILLTLLAAKGDAVSAAHIRREVPAFTRAPATLADVEHALRELEEKKHVIGTSGDGEDEHGRAIHVFTLTQNGRLRALK